VSAPSIIYRDLGSVDLCRLANYRERGGYQAFEKALTTMTPAEVVEAVKAARLVGRGGAGFPTGLKWELVAREPLTPKFVVANAEEGEPGTFKDLPILTRIPHRLIEGMLIGAYAVGATEGVIVCRGEFMEPQRILREAIAEAEAAGLLGNNILGTDFSLKLWVYRTAGAYICGEETSLLEALEGKPGMPRIRPPFPVNAGLWARPTALNNVETFANVPAIILEGPEKYAALGTERNSGTKGFCISGQVNKPGVYEIPFGVTLRQLIYDHAGGILDGRGFKAVFPGGASSSLLTAEHLDLPLDFHHVAQAGSMLGSAAFMVVAEGVCMVEVALRLARFFRHESCGKCIPCRDGTYQIVRILERMKSGSSVTCEIDDIVDLASVMQKAAFCGLGQAAPNPVLSCIKHFRSEFEDHCAGKPCDLLGGGERPYGHHH
jgi:NADH-quinone oxidoreductase subunit F